MGNMHDETEYETGFGIFEDHDQVRNMRKLERKMSEEGIVVTRSCEKCAVEVSALIGWDELYCVSKAVLPQQVHPRFSTPWVYDQVRSTMYPKLTCGQCGYLTACPFTPGEASRYLQQAHAGNLMSANQRQACTQLAQAFAARENAAKQPQQRRR